MTKISSRAKPLPVSERQAAIIHAVIPLIAEGGSHLTSRTMAEAAGVAEGTLFRAFGSKENLFRAVMASYLDADILKERLAAIDPQASLSEVVRAILEIFQERVVGIVALMSAMQIRRGGPRHGMQHHNPAARDENVLRMLEAIERRLEPLTSDMRVSPPVAARFIRSVAFSSSWPHSKIADDHSPLDIDDWTQLLIHGLAA